MNTNDENGEVMKTEVNKENMRLWVAALRSSEYEQARDQLGHSRNGKINLCCLGVACEVAISNGVDVLSAVNPDGTVSYNEALSTLPNKVKDWLGVTDDNPVIAEDHASSLASAPAPDPDEPVFEISATQANDSKRWTFEQIADAIESYYEL